MYDPSAFAVGKVNMRLYDEPVTVLDNPLPVINHPLPVLNVAPDAPCHGVTAAGNKSVRNDAAWLMLGL